MNIQKPAETEKKEIFEWSGPFKLNYFFFFFYLGVYCNLLTGHFQDLGFNGFQRALVFGLVPFISFFSNLLWGRLADLWHLRKKLISLFALISSCILTLTFFRDTYPAYLFMAFSLGLFTVPLVPLMDSLTMNHCQFSKKPLDFKPEQFSYGTFRQWGTLSFIFANLVCMFLLAFFGNRGLQGRHLLFLIPVSLAGLSFSGFFSPDHYIPEKKRIVSFASVLFEILKKRTVSVFFLGCFLHNLAFVGNYFYFSPHLKSLGFSEQFISFCWAASPVGEILIFRYSSFVLKKVSYDTLIKTGFFAAGVRWFFLSFIENPWGIFATQFLHTLAFGGFYLASITFLGKTIPSELRSSGQGLFAALTFNLATIVGNFLMGAVFEFGDTFWVFRCSTILAFLAFLTTFLTRKDCLDEPRKL